jgi:AraC-like DNA-binding protein
MKLLNDFPAEDVVSHVLRSLQVRSTVFCRSELRAPWGFGVASRDLAAFHLVVSGAAWLDVDGLEGSRRLRAGDLVILPLGHAHAMRDGPTSGLVALDDLLVGWDGDELLEHGGDGPATELLCGGFDVAGRGESPLLGFLPRIVLVPGRARRSPAWLEGTLGLIRSEFRTFHPGAEAVVSRLADVLLTQALRTVLAEADASSAPVVALRDAQIARAVSLVRGHPEHRWTDSELAGRVAMSRSAFSARFRELVGEPPMRFVTRYRLARAAELLRTTETSTLEIARRSGYQSAVSLTKAFTRHFGVSPGRYRRAQLSASASSATRPSVMRQAASSPERSERIT